MVEGTDNALKLDVIADPDKDFRVIMKNGQIFKNSSRSDRLQRARRSPQALPRKAR